MYLNIAQNQEKSTNQHLKIVDILQQLSYFERSLLGSCIKTTLMHGLSTLSTDSIKKFGGGCRDTQLKSRKKLLELGLLKKVYTRIKKDTKFNNTNIYVVADWLLDDSLAYIVRMFCKVPWYAPIRAVKLYLTEKPSSSQVDSILKGSYFLNSLKLPRETTKKEGAVDNGGSCLANKNINEEEEKTLQGGICDPKTKPYAPPFDKKTLSLHTFNAGEDKKTLGSVTRNLDFEDIYTYEKPNAVREFKDFLKSRLPRLKTSIAALLLPEEKKEEIIIREIQKYRDDLTFNDCLHLKAEGYTF